MVQRTVIYSSGPYFAKGFLWRFRGEGCFPSAAASGLGIPGGLGGGKPPPATLPFACMRIRPALHHTGSARALYCRPVSASPCALQIVKFALSRAVLMALSIGGRHRKQVQSMPVAHSTAHDAGLGGMRDAEGASASHVFILYSEDRAGHRRSMELTLLWRVSTTMTPRQPAAVPGGKGTAKCSTLQCLCWQL